MSRILLEDGVSSLLLESGDGHELELSDSLTFDSFTYTVADDWGTRTATVAVSIEGGAVLFVNANDDPATTLPGTAVVIPVLDNDNASASLLPLVVAPGSVTAPSPSGTATITAGNQIRYTPASGASGLEAIFSYTAKPSSAATPTSTAQVRVQVLSSSGPSSFVRVFPFRIASAAPADIIRPGSFSPLGINSYSVAAGKVVDLRGFRGRNHDVSQGPNIATFRMSGGANSCITGGTTLSVNQAYLAMPWAEAYGHPQWDNPPGVRVDSASGDVHVEGFHLHGTSDGLTPDSSINQASRVFYNGIYIVDCNDDGIQNDNQKKVSIRNAFVQSHTFLSERPSNSNDPSFNEITEVRNCLIWQKRQRWCGDKKFHENVSGGDTGHPQSRKVGTWNSPTAQNNANVNHQWDLHLGWGHKWWIKPDERPGGPVGFFRTRLDMRHVLIRMDTIPVEGTDVVFPPIGDGIGGGSTRGSFYENVVVLWMQGGSWPFPPVPPGVSVITNTDQAYALWQQEQAAWYTANGYDSVTETFSWTRLT